MRELTLSEQMGAMAIVDDLRHRQLQVNDHLNLPARREEAARRIREYYQEQNIDADDALIEQGVRQFFSNRFTYDAPILPFWSRTLASFHTRRGIHAKRLLAVSICAALIFGAGIGVRTGYTAIKVNHVESEANKAAFGVSELKSEIGRQTDQLIGFTSSHDPGAVPFADQQIETIKGNLKKAGDLISFNWPAAIDHSNYSAISEKLDGFEQSFYEAKNLLWKNRTALTTVSDVYSASDAIVQLTSTESFQHAQKRYPVLQALADNARVSIAHADVDGGRQAAEAGQKLKATIGKIPNLDMLSAKIGRTLELFRRMGLSASDLAKVTSSAAKADEYIRDLDYDAAESLVDYLTGMIPFAEQSLSIEIVTKPLSAAERMYKPARGKAWFFLVQAKDAGGNVIRAPVTDSESGDHRMASTFGVRVDQDSYLQLKEDKRDGHLEDAHLGDKPAKSLTIKWADRTLSSNPDTILNWRD